MNNLFNRKNITYLVIKSLVIVFLISFFDNRGDGGFTLNLPFYSFNELTKFALEFLVAFFVLLIVDVIKEYK